MSPKAIKSLKLLLISIIISLVFQPALIVQAENISPQEYSVSEKSQEESPSQEYMANLASFAPVFSVRQTLDLSIPQLLSVTRPVKDISTTLSQYFITGTSDPEQELYLDDEIVPRVGTKGVFGIMVDIESGDNLFEFAQEEETVSITIKKETPKTVEKKKTISTIVDGSMVPSSDTVYKSGDIIILSCVAPSGQQVFATVDGQDYELKQLDTTIKQNYPATYQASYTMPDIQPNNITKSLGEITYTLMFSDWQREQYSLGRLYVAGTDAKTMVRVSNYIGFVYPDVSNLSVFKEMLKKGSSDYITGQNGAYFTLKSGGSIPRSMVEIITDTSSISNAVETTTYSQKTRGEYYIFYGSETPVYNCTINDDSFVIELYNTYFEDTGIPEGTLFEKPQVTTEDYSTTLVFPFKENMRNHYWGYNVVFNDNNMYLEFQHAPTLSRTAKPLKNIRVLLDPGHGGTDIGAPGITGENTGPSESEVNLAHAYAIKDKLTALGATVELTRNTESFITLDKRLQLFANQKPDLFISVHHNSIEINTDSNYSMGTESYYYTDISQSVSSALTESIAEIAGRNLRGVYQSYYRVTLLPYAPSTLLEIGFVSNPLEYEKACDPEEIDLIATAVSQGVIDSIKGLDK